MDAGRQLRSGTVAFGSIPIAAVAAGVYALMVPVRFASLRLALDPTPETVDGTGKEAPMSVARKLSGVCLETAWALGVSVAAGLLLLS